jgi:hypothetical protein
MPRTVDKLQTEMILAYLAKKRKPVTPDLQKYYEDRFSMMGSDGWKDLVEDIDTMISSLNNISVILDEQSLQFKKGELSILTWLKTLKEVSERAYEELNEKNV